MKSILSARLSPDHFWEFTYLCFAVYLLFHPALAFPQSNAVVLGGGLVLFLFRAIPRDSLEKLGVFWFLFLLFGLASAFWSVSSGVSLQSSGFLFLATLLLLMAGKSGSASQNRVELWVQILALIAAGIGLYQWLFGFTQLAPLVSHFAGEDADILAAAVHNKRAFGPLVTPGALAALLIFVLPQTLIRFWTASGFKKILLGLFAVFLFLALAATGGVGAWVCLAVSLGFLFYKQNAGPRSLLMMGLFLLAALALIWHRGFHSWTLAAFSMRLQLWQSAWQLFLRHPWMGWGLGTFGEVYQSAGLPLGTGALYAHNLFLQLLVETGAVGTLFLVLALGSLASRFKWPARWEGWGVLGGCLAVFLFSFVDLPFQMAELVWIFAGVAGRLEWRSSPAWKWPELSPSCISIGLLMVLAVTGFWPPYRPWNFCLLAVSLWTAFALFESQIKELKWWIVLGAFYMAFQAFNSPSASGAVWFLELTGLLMVFYFMAPKLPWFQNFWIVFAGLGLLWAVKLVWYCFTFTPPDGMSWFQFQTVDVIPWVFNPNPKHLAIFLVPFVFILFRKSFSISGLKTVLAAFSLLVIFRLKGLAALAGLSAGWLWSLRKKPVKLLMMALILMSALTVFRYCNTSSTKLGRFDIWQSALRVWAESPLLGVGPGVFAGEFHRVQAPRLDGVNQYLMDAVYAHNEFLDLLAAFGLAGFVFVLTLALYLFKQTANEANKNALIGLGAASFFDFCLHTPLIALLGVSCLTKEEKPVQRLSGVGGFLTLGLALGLFGAPAFAPFLRNQAESYTAQARYPEAFRYWRTAVSLNAWDAGMIRSEADFYEQLFGMTRDNTWKTKSDETFDTAVNLEKADGNLVFERAKRWTRRYETDLSEESRLTAQKCWLEARKALPLNAFTAFEEGLFCAKVEQLAPQIPQPIAVYRGEALDCFRRATLLEPNFAAAWVNLGLCQLKMSYPHPGQAEQEAQFAFGKALAVYDQWNDAPGLSPEEKQMVDLPSPEVVWLRKRVKP